MGSVQIMATMLNVELTLKHLMRQAGSDCTRLKLSWYRTRYQLCDAEVRLTNQRGVTGQLIWGVRKKSMTSWMLNELEHCGPAVQWPPWGVDIFVVQPPLPPTHTLLYSPPHSPTSTPYSLRISLHSRAVKHHTAANPLNNKIVTAMLWSRCGLTFFSRAKMHFSIGSANAK